MKQEEYLTNRVEKDFSWYDNTANLTGIYILAQEFQ